MVAAGHADEVTAGLAMLEDGGNSDYRHPQGRGAIYEPVKVDQRLKDGDKVRLGDVVVVLEAMKMQNDIVATVGGTVREVFAKEGAIVAPNDVLMTIG